MSESVVRGRPEAAALFLGPPKALDASALRRSGIVRAGVAWAFAALLFFLGRSTVGSIAATLGTITFLLAIASPTRGYAALSKIVDRVAELVGRLLAWVLLAPVFFLFFVPFRFLFRRGLNDALARGFDPARPSYWSPHDRPRDLEKPY